jgi:outer membrane protein OmpA-like peptidoglycan-associated protein
MQRALHPTRAAATFMLAFAMCSNFVSSHAGQAAPPPRAEGATFTVSFPSGHADLTPPSQVVVAEAASASANHTTTRIVIYGDGPGTTGCAPGLPMRRASNIQAELVRDGVAPRTISIREFSAAKLPAPTARGGSFPSNRSVEILCK